MGRGVGGACCIACWGRDLFVKMEERCARAMGEVEGLEGKAGYPLSC